MAIVAGVDGCRGGWLAILRDSGSGRLEIALQQRWCDLPLDAAAMVAVDMPIGLADRGQRACDRAARALLPRGRKSSVFAPPRRGMLDCRGWPEAHARGKALEGRGLSRQAWNLVEKIRELDRGLRPRDQDRVREAHPELVFHHLNSWRPVSNKKTARGRQERLRLLASAGIAGVDVLMTRYPRSAAQADDYLDAAACTLAATRMLAGRAVRLPVEPPCDACGRRMEIWY